MKVSWLGLAAEVHSHHNSTATAGDKLHKTPATETNNPQRLNAGASITVFEETSSWNLGTVIASDVSQSIKTASGSLRTQHQQFHFTPGDLPRDPSASYTNLLATNLNDVY